MCTGLPLWCFRGYCLANTRIKSPGTHKVVHIELPIRVRWPTRWRGIYCPVPIGSWNRWGSTRWAVLYTPECKQVRLHSPRFCQKCFGNGRKFALKIYHLYNEIVSGFEWIWRLKIRKTRNSFLFRVIILHITKNVPLVELFLGDLIKFYI